MAVNLGDGLKLRGYIDGVLQLMFTELSLEIDGQNQPLETLEGLAGKTPGSGRVTITFTAVVPIGGQEFDVVSAVQNGGYHDFQIPLGAKSYVDKGYFDKATVSQSVGKPTEVSATWIGAFSRPK
jgi:hypothetical protein